MTDYCLTCQKTVDVRKESQPGWMICRCVICGTVTDQDFDEDDYDYGDGSQDDPHRKTCWVCHGEAYGIVGTDFDSDDPINGPYPGEITKCPCCHGSGKAEDETYW